MTPEEREILRRVEVLAEENNDLLRKMVRRSRIGTTFRILYWLVIIALSFGTDYYLQPYFQKLIPLMNSAEQEINAAKNL